MNLLRRRTCLLAEVFATECVSHKSTERARSAGSQSVFPHLFCCTAIAVATTPEYKGGPQVFPHVGRSSERGRWNIPIVFMELQNESLPPHRRPGRAWMGQTQTWMRAYQKHYVLMTGSPSWRVADCSVALIELQHQRSCRPLVRSIDAQHCTFWSLERSAVAREISSKRFKS